MIHVENKLLISLFCQSYRFACNGPETSRTRVGAQERWAPNRNPAEPQPPAPGSKTCAILLQTEIDSLSILNRVLLCVIFVFYTLIQILMITRGKIRNYR